MAIVESTNFRIVIPFGEGAIAPIDVQRQDPPGGAYEVEIVSAKHVANDSEGGKVTLQLGVVIVEDGPARGMTTTVYMGCDFSKPFNVAHLYTLLLSMGANKERVRGQVPVEATTFIGKRAYIFVRTPMEGELDDQGKKKRPDKNFQTREQYEAAKSAARLLAGPGTVTPITAARASPTTIQGPVNGAPVNGAAVPPPPGPASAVELNDMFAR